MVPLWLMWLLAFVIVSPHRGWVQNVQSTGLAHKLRLYSHSPVFSLHLFWGKEVTHHPLFFLLLLYWVNSFCIVKRILTTPLQSLFTQCLQYHDYSDNIHYSYSSIYILSPPFMLLIFLYSLTLLYGRYLVIKSLPLNQTGISMCCAFYWFTHLIWSPHCSQWFSTRLQGY